MRLFNETAHPAVIFSGDRGPDVMHASLVTRVRHKFDKTGKLAPPDEADVLTGMRRDRIEDDYGVIEPDVPFPRVATDVIVLADALAPAPTRTAKVTLRVGPYNQELTIVGDRTWERGPGGYVPSPAQPFTRLPLTWAHAFGGKAPVEYGDLPWAANPLGKGYCLLEASVVGTKLPNIEDPQAPLRRWDERPEPVGFAPYPVEWQLRSRMIYEAGPDTDGIILHPERGMFDRAHPRLSGKPVRANDEIEVVGTAFAPKLRMRVPPCPVELVLRLGDKEYVREPELEEVLLDLRFGLLDLTYRKPCNYAFVPYEQRSMTLRGRAG